MRRLYFLLFSVSLLTACSSGNDETTEDVPGEELEQKQPGLKNGGYVDGIHFNPDSIANEALAMYYETEINTRCTALLTNLVEKNKKEDRGAYQTVLTFELTKDKLDSLRYFGISQDMISTSDASKPIYLIANKKGGGKYELSRVSIRNYKSQFPVLFAYGKQVFLNDKQPKLVNLTVTGQTTQSLEYSAEFQFADEQSTYVYFTAKSDRQNLQIVLNKSDD